MLTEKQKQAVKMVYDNDPIGEIAAALGVHRTTIWRWQRKREFRKEWHRLDRNARRRIVRREAKLRAAEDAYWSDAIRKAKDKLDRETAKIKTKPGNAWYKAHEEYQTALLHGRTLAQALEALELISCKRHKRRSRK